jgi:hypothetical protein
MNEPSFFVRLAFAVVEVLAKAVTNIDARTARIQHDSIYLYQFGQM